jgi:hypothetical protein
MIYSVADSIVSFTPVPTLRSRSRCCMTCIHTGSWGFLSNRNSLTTDSVRIMIPILSDSFHTITIEQSDKCGIQHHSDEFESVPEVFGHNKSSHGLELYCKTVSDIFGLYTCVPVCLCIYRRDRDSLQHSSNSSHLSRFLCHHSGSLAEVFPLCISVVFSTKINNIVCISSNRHHVAFFSMHPLLQTRTSCHIASWSVLCPVLSKNGFYSGYVMLIVILHTLRQPFPFQLLLSKCWGPCDIRSNPPPTDTIFHKRHTQGKLLESVMS